MCPELELLALALVTVAWFIKILATDRTESKAGWIGECGRVDNGENVWRDGFWVIVMRFEIDIF